MGMFCFCRNSGANVSKYLNSIILTTATAFSNVPIISLNVCAHLRLHEGYLTLAFTSSLQVNADCSDDVPPDYELSVSGPPTNPVTGGSDMTMSESSMALDRLPHLHHEPESLTQLEVGPRIASSEYSKNK